MILSDLARHLGHALAESGQTSPEDTLEIIVGHMLEELGHPTTEVEGGFR